MKRYRRTKKELPHDVTLEIISDQEGTRYLLTTYGFGPFEISMEDLVTKGYFEVVYNYPFLEVNSEKVVEMLTQMFDDVVKDRFKWFLINDSEGKHAGVICNADEYMRLKGLD